MVSANMSSDACSRDSGCNSPSNYVPVDKNLIELRQKALSFNQPNERKNDVETLSSQSPLQ